MSVEPRHVPLRAARNRVLDLLGIGDTCPLTDLGVPAEDLKVAAGGLAEIRVEDAQIGVIYELLDPDGKPAGNAAGQGQALKFPPLVIERDITYRIRATKTKLPDRSQQPACLLEQAAPVKVGINTGTGFEIKAEPLASMYADAKYPRLVSHGASADVEISASQQGVKYALVLTRRDAPAEPVPWAGPAVSGNLGAITLSTGPMTEDILVRVRATRAFPPGDKREDEVKFLDLQRYLAVRPDPKAEVWVEPNVAGYKEPATVRIKGQKTALYLVCVHAVADDEYVRENGPPGGSYGLLPVAGNPKLQVSKPRPQPSGSPPWGYKPLGTMVAGGDDVKVAIAAPEADTAILVKAMKMHVLDPASPNAVGQSWVWLDKGAVLLVKPNPGVDLRLRVQPDGVRFLNGDRGVFYYLPEQNSAMPAYFHKRDPQNNEENKGLEQIALEVDFVVAADADVSEPVVAIQPLAAGSKLELRAAKAQHSGGVEMTKLARGALISPVQVSVKEGKIVVAGSDPQERYQLRLGGNKIGDSVAGNGGDLELGIPASGTDAVFELVITREADKERLALERVVQVR